MLRALVALLLLANLGFLALSRGWFGPTFTLAGASEREPQRLAAQIDPDGVRVVAAPADAARVPPPRCLQAGPLRAEAVDAAEALLQQAGVDAGGWTRTAEDRPEQWHVVLGRIDDAAALRRQVDELRRAGFAVEQLDGYSELRGTLSIGHFGERAGAEAALADARQRGVRGLRLVSLAPVTLEWLRVAAAGPALRARLIELPIEPPGAAFAPCPKPP